MNPDDPPTAQRIVSEYAGVLERHLGDGALPATQATLPHPKATIKAAVRTCVKALTWSGQLTDELQAFLEEIYVSLAEYVEPEFARLMAEYREAAAALEADGRPARAKVDTAAWQVLARSGRLVGEIGRLMAEEAHQLRQEFRMLVDEAAEAPPGAGGRSETDCEGHPG